MTEVIKLAVNVLKNDPGNMKSYRWMGDDIVYMKLINLKRIVKTIPGNVPINCGTVSRG